MAYSNPSFWEQGGKVSEGEGERDLEIKAHLPVEEIRKALGTVTLVDTLTASLLAEADHLIGELSD